MANAKAIAVGVILIIALAAISMYVAYAFGGARPGVPGSEGNAVRMVNFRFVPQTIEIQAGQTVTWTNEDNALHTVEGFGENANVPAGGTFSHTFATPGSYDYACTIHPGMTGTVIVR